MRFIFNEDQILRLKKNLSKFNINEDELDNLITKGSDAVNNTIKKGKELIPGLDIDVEKKKEDVPTKADFVGDNVEDFYKILEGIDRPIQEQRYGSMTHQQSVEAVQIALQILGYKLPRFGTDGLFGPETSAAVKKFKSDNNIAGNIDEAFVEIGDTSYSYVKVDSDSSRDDVNQALLDDLQAAGEAADVVVTITTAVSGHSKETVTGNKSRHGFGTAVDIALLNGVGVGNKKFEEYGDKLKEALVSMGYVLNSETNNPKAVLWKTNIGGNHYNHLHVSNKEGVSGLPADGSGDGEKTPETITPKMAVILVDKLKAKDITSEDIKKYIDPAVTTGGSLEFTDLDLTTTEGKETYETICDNYIKQRAPGAPVTGTMLADSAQRAFKQYRKYVPPELALAQVTIEGGLDSKPTSRPMKTKNPFNVGNTGDGKNKYFNSFEEGVDAYYSLIARKYLVKGKTAKDLVSDFSNDAGNKYQGNEGEYEAKLRTQVNSIRKKNEPIYAALAKKKETQNLAEELLAEADKRQVLKNTFGFDEDWANEFHNLSDKLSLWIADTFIKEMINLYRSEVPEGQDIKRYVINLLNDQGPQGNDGWTQRYKPRYEYILHWVRAPRREQINIRELTLDGAYDLAQEWHDSLQVRKQSNFNETGDVFIDYRNADGVGYYWVNLHTNYCSEEAERMGHCARANTPGSELISLRRVNEFGEGESYLTVDYRPGGVIGDFHRHGNKKPTARFHRQIVDFLTNTRYPVTQLTSQGVHRYDENFHISDLSQADLQRVYQGNPNLRYNINDEGTWPEIINGLISDELSLSHYSTDIKLKLFKKATTINKGDEMKELFSPEMIMDMMDDFARLQSNLKEFFMQQFGGQLANIMISALDGNTTNPKQLFTDSLREISQNMFEYYQELCPYIDHGFRKFTEDERIEILSARGIKRSLFACSDVVPFLSRYASNSPVDTNGNIAVKTEEGLWGLLKQDGTTVLLPQFAGITPNRMDKTGKTYLVKNLQGAFFIFNPETGDYKRFTMK